MLKKIIRTLILNRVHIIASAPAIMWCWSEFLKMPFRGIDYFIITLTVACICEGNRITDIVEDKVNCPDDLVDAQIKSKAIRFFCFAGGSTALILALITEPTWELAGLVAFGAAVGYFYNSSPLPSRHDLRLKSMFIVKNLSSGAGWSAGLLVFPMLRSHAQPEMTFFIAFAYMFCTVATYEIMWDIRDIDGDSRAGIRTLPIVLGTAHARMYAVVLQCICLGLILTGLMKGILTPLWSLFLLPGFGLITLIILFPNFIRYNRNLSHILVVALCAFACLGALLASRFG